MPGEDLKHRVDWLDEERRKDKAQFARLEEKLAGLETTLAAQAKQLKEMSAQVARIYGKFQPGQIEELLARQREEVAHSLEASENRRLESEDKLTHVRATEHEATERALADVHRQLGALGELREALEARREEETRLAAALQETRKSLEALHRHDEERGRTQAAMEEARRQDLRRMGEIQGESQALRQKHGETDARLEALETAARRLEARTAELSAVDLERRNALALWQEQQAAAGTERDRQWKEWERVVSALPAQMKEHSERMMTYAETHHAMRQAVDEFGQLSEGTEQRLHELEEVLRLGSDRLRQEWTTFLADDQKRWTAQGLTREDRWREHDRQNQKSLDRFTHLDDQVSAALDEMRTLHEADRTRLETLANLIREWLARLE